MGKIGGFVCNSGALASFSEASLGANEWIVPRHGSMFSSPEHWSPALYFELFTPACYTFIWVLFSGFWKVGSPIEILFGFNG